MSRNHQNFCKYHHILRDLEEFRQYKGEKILQNLLEYDDFSRNFDDYDSFVKVI